MAVGEEVGLKDPSPARDDRPAKIPSASTNKAERNPAVRLKTRIGPSRCAG